MRNRNTKAMALCGVTAALAVVIGAMGGMIPVATYVIPTLQCMILQLILSACGVRFAWSWYGCVTVLNLLLCPDKEAAAVFCAIGYYPMAKQKLDKTRLSGLWKGLLFNAVILILYWLLMHLFGFDRISAEFAEMGTVMTVLMLVLGNVTFFLLDRLLGMGFRKR